MLEDSKTFHPSYRGTTGDIFKLVFVTGLLTILTLGIYRFWAKTRVRRFVWSSVRVDGDPAEYTGTGLEKFLGFLVAIVVLAIYLGLLQLILSFVGFNLIGAFGNPEPSPEQMLAQMGAFYITLFAVLPLMFFAQYRGRRYMLSRTRWRGLRFGMSPGALGYMGRACLYIIGPLVLLVLLGALMGYVSSTGSNLVYVVGAVVLVAIFVMPVVMFAYSTFMLKKYMIDRQWFGDGKFQQNGKWTALIPMMKHFLFALLVLFGGVGLGAWLELFGLTLVVGIVGYLWFFYAFAHFSVHSYRYLANNQVLDGQITFEATTRVGEIVKTYIVGGLIVVAISAAVFLPVGLIGMDMIMSFGMGGGVASLILPLILYLLAFAVIGAATMAFINQPVLAHYVTTTGVQNAQHLTAIQQRSADDFADADGFADALDVGGAF